MVKKLICFGMILATANSFGMQLASQYTNKSKAPKKTTEQKMENPWSDKNLSVSLRASEFLWQKERLQKVPFATLYQLGYQDKETVWYLLDTIKLGAKKETLTVTDDRYNAVAQLNPIIKNCFPNKYCCIPADLSTQIQRTAQRAFTWGGIGGTIGLVGGGLYGGYSDAKEYNNNKKAVAIRSFKETFDTLYPQIHSDKVKTEIIKSDCIHNTVRDSFQNWPTSRIFHTKRDDYCAQDDELGKILGEEMRQHNGNIMKAYPNAVDRFCYEKHNTDEIQEQAKNEAFPLAMEVAAQAMQSIPAPASFSWEKAGQGAMAGLGIGITAGTIYTIACTDDLTRPIKHTEIPNM